MPKRKAQRKSVRAKRGPRPRQRLGSESMRALGDVDALDEAQVRELKLEARRWAPPALGDVGAGPEALAAQGPVLVAEGDSWFDFPIGVDLLDWLSLEHGRRMVRFAKAGDTLENMVYGTDLRNVHTRREPSITEVLAAVREHQPPVFLFSAGGNDVAGDEFAAFLNHADSGLPAVREEYAAHMMGSVFPRAINHLIDRVRAESRDTVVVMHGYARPVPTGTGVDLLFWTFAGPWLKPSLMRKNITQVAAQKAVIRGLIDRYNDVLAGIAAARPGEFRFVDLRGLVHDSDWRDELHLNNSAWKRCAERIDGVIAEILAGN